MDSIKGTLSAVSGATGQTDASSSTDTNSGSQPSTLDSIKDTLSSITGTGGQTESSADTNKRQPGAGPIPEETGLQSRGQTTESSSGTFLGEAKDTMDPNTPANVGFGGAGDDQAQVEDFIRSKYTSRAGEDGGAK